LLFLKIKQPIILNLKNIKLNPWHYLILSFAILILSGTFLLKLPFVIHKNGLTFIDALFTSTSAVCVTGLTVVNTSGFNLAGEIVLLLLMQAGAIGIMTISSSLVLLIKGDLDLKRRMSFAKLQDSFSLKSASGILPFIVKMTFIVEIIGAVFLTVGFIEQGLTLKEAIHQGIFHSISAFCNAGFSTFDSSIIGMNWIIKYTIMLLIIIGGLGYYVIFELYQKYKGGSRISFYSKIVISTTIFLIFIGAILLLITEQGKLSITDGLFQSVTARTAGFNSIDLNNMHVVSWLIIIVLMLIGASPGSTGGGIKTSTFFIIVVSIFKVLRGETSLTIFQRHISHQIIIRAFAILIIYFFVIIVATGLLLFNSNYKFINSFFEVTSALGTVGLTSGISSKILTSGKIILILCMFLGRIGPASLAMVTLGNERKVKVKYPKEKIILG